MVCNLRYYLLLNNELVLSLKNFNLTPDFVTRMIDNYRDDKLKYYKTFNVKKSKDHLRILHITNFNERLDGRLFFNTGRIL